MASYLSNEAESSSKMEHPRLTLEKMAKDRNLDMDSMEFAESMDEGDHLKHLRSQFLYPKMRDLPHVDLSVVDPEEDAIYFCGHSLGLQPKGVEKYINRELDKWAKIGVYGHFMGETPWAYSDKYTMDGQARLAGAKTEEIAVMNGLSVNIHLMMIPFYRPTATRHKILLEAKAFPSDHYAIESQIRFHGYDPSTSMICVEPRRGEHCLRTEDILDVIEREGDSIALIFFSGVHFYTGQLFEISGITRAGQAKGCVVGWDLAHAAGNVPLHLHDWNVDFATWCSYKYLNSSCGGLGVVFVHERYKDAVDLPRFCGWWSHQEQTRMNMTNKLELTPGAAGFRISNPPVLLVCPMLASLDIFAQTTMQDLRQRSLLLTGYLEWLIHKHFKETQDHGDKKTVTCEIITPADPNQRGCQLSLLFSINIHRVYAELQKLGVVCDKRLPFVLRVAPVHTYNNFVDVYRFIRALRQALVKVGDVPENDFATKAVIL